MRETSRVQRWRDDKRQQGLKALTVWLTTEDERRLKALALAWHCSPSAVLQQALAAYQPGVPAHPRPDAGADETPPQVDVLGLLAPRIRSLVQQEMRAAQAVMTHEITQTLHMAIVGDLPALVHQIQTESVTDTVTEMATDTARIMSTLSVTETNGDVTDTDAPRIMDPVSVTDMNGGVTETAPPTGMKQCGKRHAPYPASKAECPHCVRERQREYKQRKKDQRRGQVPA